MPITFFNFGICTEPLWQNPTAPSSSSSEVIHVIWKSYYSTIWKTVWYRSACDANPYCFVPIKKKLLKMCCTCHWLSEPLWCLVTRRTLGINMLSGTTCKAGPRAGVPEHTQTHTWQSSSETLCPHGKFERDTGHNINGKLFGGASIFFFKEIPNLTFLKN